MATEVQSDEAEIVTAIRKFKSRYDWDKSLCKQSQTAINEPLVIEPHSNTSIEDFLNAKRK
jgi:hypothetical protein